MSVQIRQSLVASPNTFFQRHSQRDDLLSVETTKSELIGLLWFLVQKGHFIEFTAVKSDHHDDSALGEHCHFNGYCSDVWPLASAKAGDYLDASDPRFQAFLRDAAHCQYLYQIGLAGSADTSVNKSAAAPHVFSDDGSDHVHLSAL